MNVRQLEPLEWLELQTTLIEQFSEGLPDPAETRIFVIEDDAGGRMGFLQVESLAVHIRHIHIEEEHRGSGAAEMLVDHVRELFRSAGKRAHLIATTPFAEKLAEHAGMTRLDGVIYEGNGQ